MTSLSAAAAVQQPVPVDSPVRARDVDPDTAAQRWFAALDGRTFERTEQRTVRVLGIHGHGSELWVQLSVDDDPRSSIILHVRPWTNVQDALEQVRRTLLPPRR